MSGGSSPKPAKPKDMTPGAYKELRGPLADLFSDWLGFETTQKTVYDRVPIMGMKPGRDGSSELGIVGWGQKPRTVTERQYTGNSGMPRYEGPTTAPLSPLEEYFLGAITGHQRGSEHSRGILDQLISNPLNSSALGTLQQLQQLSGGNINPFANIPGGEAFLAGLFSGQGLPQTNLQAGGGLLGQGQQALQGVAGSDPLGSFINPAVGQSIGQTLGGDFLHAESNPYLQSAIEAAQRPLLQAFQEQTIPQLKAQFTAAGQMIQPQGSSPFDMAAARATSGLMDAIGDVGTKMAFANYDAERARQMQAAGLGIQQGQVDQTGRLQQMGLQTQAGQALGQLGLGAAELLQRGDLAGLQAQLDAMGIGLSAEELAQQVRAQDMDRAGQAARDQAGIELEGREQQLRAIEQSLNLGQGELDQMIKQLQAVALPRLIQQHGIDAGMALFQQDMDRLMAVLQLATGASSPNVAVTGATPGQSSPLPGILGGVGSIAGAIGGAPGIGAMFK